YTTPFNAKCMAANIVDCLRGTTDAPLSDCVLGASETCRLLNQHVKSEELNEVLNILVRFEIDEANCADAKELARLTTCIIRLCSAKEELGHTAFDYGTDLNDHIHSYCDIVKKTHPKVVQNALKDFEVVRGICDFFIKEQSKFVVEVLADGIRTLCQYSDSIPSFLVETPLLMNVVSRLENCPLENLSSYHTSLFTLIRAVLASENPPPIDVIQYLNKNLSPRLWLLTSNGYMDAISTLVMIHRWRIDGIGEEGVVQALKQGPNANIGSRLTESYIRDPSPYKFELLDGIFEDKDLVETIFYSNDIPVLLHICCDHLLNEEDVDLKKSILRFFITAGRNGFFDDQTILAINRCDVGDSLKEEAWKALIHKDTKHIA
ncbi:hypothetical protein PFISCL1PPCAC_15479, partial [Pristionchus fissidentatus]